MRRYTKSFEYIMGKFLFFLTFPTLKLYYYYLYMCGGMMCVEVTLCSWFFFYLLWVSGLKLSLSDLCAQCLNTLSHLAGS